MFVIRLKDVSITSFQTGDGGGEPIETFAFTFADVEFEYGEEKK